MFYRSSGGFARHYLVSNLIAPRPTSQKELIDGKNFILLSVTWPRKSYREELVFYNQKNRGDHWADYVRARKVIIILTTYSALFLNSSFYFKTKFWVFRL